MVKSVGTLTGTAPVASGELIGTGTQQFGAIASDLEILLAEQHAWIEPQPGADEFKAVVNCSSSRHAKHCLLTTSNTVSSPLQQVLQGL